MVEQALETLRLGRIRLSNARLTRVVPLQGESHSHSRVHVRLWRYTPFHR